MASSPKLMDALIKELRSETCDRPATLMAIRKALPKDVGDDLLWVEGDKP